jgi:hypothetical protein
MIFSAVCTLMVLVLARDGLLGGPGERGQIGRETAI